MISANLEGKALGDAMAEIEGHIGSMNLPADYRFEFIGRAKTMAEATANFVIGFALSFLLMYMVLAGQFESFLHPITILLALPLTIPFALMSLLLLRTNLDIYAMFGLFMLFGSSRRTASSRSTTRTPCARKEWPSTTPSWPPTARACGPSS